MSNYLFKNPVTPLSNVQGNYVNVDSSSWPGRFGSTETSRQFALPDNFSNNAVAANASRISMSGGGRGKKHKHTIRKKIKNIVNKYRMGSKKMRKHTKRRLMTLYKRKGSKSSHKSRKTRRHHKGGNTVLYKPIVSSQTLKLQDGTNVYSNGPVAGVNNPYNVNQMSGGKRRGRKMQKGGYHQYQSNIPMTQTYSTGGILDAKNLALANPVPYQVLSNCTNCIDNYDYNTDHGFQFW
jgi:hypothetical protein